MYNVLCFLQGQTVFTYLDGTLTTDERYDGRTNIVERPEFSGSVTINVSSLRESDTGDYKCSVLNSGDGLRSSYSPSSLQPTLPPLPPSLSSTPSSIDISDGVHFRLDIQGRRVM